MATSGTPKKQTELKVGDILEPTDYSTDSGEIYVVNLEDVQMEATTFLRVFWTVDRRMMMAIRMRGSSQVVPLRRVFYTLGVGAAGAAILTVSALLCGYGAL